MGISNTTPKIPLPDSDSSLLNVIFKLDASVSDMESVYMLYVRKYMCILMYSCFVSVVGFLSVHTLHTAITLVIKVMELRIRMC